MANRIDALKEQIENVIRQCIGEDMDIPISPALVAKCAMDILDPDNITPSTVAYAANLELRQVARKILRRAFDPIDPDNTQSEMFENLQDKYPAHRGDEIVYVPRMQLTYDERMYNVSRIEKEAESKLRHADELRAETEELAAQGFFDEVINNST